MTFEGYYFDRSDQIILASSRVAGICTGVLAALLLTCTVFPISGSGLVRLLITSRRLRVPAHISGLRTQADHVTVQPVMVGSGWVDEVLLQVSSLRRLLGRPGECQRPSSQLVIPHYG